MTPAVIQLLVSVLLKYGPEAAAAAQKLFATTAPTQADWDALFDKAKTSFESYLAGGK